MLQEELTKLLHFSDTGFPFLRPANKHFRQLSLAIGRVKDPVERAQRLGSLCQSVLGFHRKALTVTLDQYKQMAGRVEKQRARPASK